MLPVSVPVPKPVSGSQWLPLWLSLVPLLSLRRALRPSALLSGLCLVALAGCAALPRGAGLQREVLAEAATQDGVVVADQGSSSGIAADVAVETVTREALPVFAAWPRLGEDRLRWIAQSDDPAGPIIAPGDRVTVTVWDAEQNSLLTPPGQRQVVLPTMTVSPAGRIFLPYVGEVRIAGMGPDRARAAIEEQYLDVVPSAQVQLETEPGSASAVSVVGGVGAPGSFPLAGRDRTVLNLLAEAGGVRANLVNPQIRLIRGREIYGTSVARLFDTPSLDTTVRGGDRIVVEEDDRFFMSLGAAGREAMYPFVRDRMTALEALSAIGGVSDTRADPKGILILREYPAQAVRADRQGPGRQRVVFVIDLTSADGLFSAGQFEINSGDLVYVSESPLVVTQTIFGLIGSVFGLARQITN